MQQVVKDVELLTELVNCIAVAKAEGDGARVDEVNFDLYCYAQHFEEEKVRALASVLVDRVALARYRTDMAVEHTEFGRRELSTLIGKLKLAERKAKPKAVAKAVAAIEKFAADDPIFDTACAVARGEAVTFLRLRANPVCN